MTAEEKLEQITEAIRAVKNGGLTPYSFVVVISMIIEPTEVTEADFAWARQKIAELGLKSESRG